MFLLYVFFLVWLFPAYAWAYLDPGTGNLLVYVIVSLIGTGIFFIKNAYYKVRDRLGHETTSIVVHDSFHRQIAIFTEGRAYWGTFKPIVESLIERGRDFSYLSLDVTDPGLAIDNPHMDSRFLGDGTSAFAKVASFRAKVMASTTPNIGTPGFPLPAPRYVGCLAHVCHGVGSVATYMKHSLDCYQAVLLVGRYLEDDIRHLEALRKLPPKECVPAGLPYLDEMVPKVAPKSGLSDPPVILAAPSWGDKGFLSLCGTGFLADLAKKGYELIIRPHPQSKKAEPGLLAAVQAEMAPFKNVAFDYERDASSSMAKADLLISDVSSVRFDFALLYNRPVITIDVPIRNVAQYELSDLDTFWDNEVAPELGAILKPNELGELDATIKKVLGVSRPDILAFRDRYISNYGCAGPFIADWLISKAESLGGED